jgi:hypothetical protein
MLVPLWVEHVQMDGMRQTFVFQMMVVPLGTFLMEAIYTILVMDTAGFIMIANMTAVVPLNRGLQVGVVKLIGMK